MTTPRIPGACDVVKTTTGVFIDNTLPYIKNILTYFKNSLNITF